MLFPNFHVGSVFVLDLGNYRCQASRKKSFEQKSSSQLSLWEFLWSFSEPPFCRTGGNSICLFCDRVVRKNYMVLWFVKRDHNQVLVNNQVLVKIEFRTCVCSVSLTGWHHSFKYLCKMLKPQCGYIEGQSSGP